MLELREVTVAYGGRVALHQVDLRVEQGEIVSLVGANGAGKTTLINTVSGVLHPQSGQVSYQEQPLNRLAPYQVLSLGLAQVPEGRRIFPEMTVMENLLLGGHTVTNHDLLSQRLEKVLALFPILNERSRQQAETLSGGEQQMLAIGRALMTDPDLLMLDEPTMGLAPLIVKLVADVIKAVRAEGKTVLLVEQNAVLALRLADRGYVIENGWIVLSDTGANLLENDEVRRAYLGI